MGSKKWLLGIVITIATVVLLAGCGGQSKTEKVLRVGSETTFPPMEFSEDGKYVGFDVDLSNALAKEMGYDKMEFVSMGFDALIPAIQGKQIDMIAAGLVITPARKEKVLFSDPYYESGLVMVVRKDYNEVNTVEDLANKTIGAQVGTTGATLGKEKPGTTVKELDTINQLFLELQNKGIDVVILDKPVAQYFIKQGSGNDFKVVGDMVKNSSIALAFNSDNKDLQEKANAALKKLHENGTYDKIYSKWLGDLK